MKAFEAVKLFNEMRDNPELHNEKPQTGCFIRADKICKNMVDQGFDAYVVITEDKLNENITGRLAYREQGQSNTDKPTMVNINWGFHVAAAAMVKDVNGNEQLLVFDTGLFDGPATIDSWARTMFKDGRALSSDDIKNMNYDPEGKKMLSDIRSDVGYDNDEDFFAKQPDKYADKKIIHWPSQWLKKHNNTVSMAKASKQK